MNFRLLLHAGLEVEVEGYSPERPAPCSNNPDSLSFSDPGDDAEYEDYKVYVVFYEEKIDITDKISEKFSEILHQKILLQGEKENHDTTYT